MNAEAAARKLAAGCRQIGECLIWARATTGAGYGQIWIGGAVLYTHRLAYELAKGPLDGLNVLHACDMPACCNPAHLIKGTQRQNLADMRSKGRHAHGASVGTAKLTAQIVAAIRADSRSQYVIASQYAINQSQVSRIKNKVQWSHV